MLQSIAPYVSRYTQVIAAVTNINVEVVDADLLRIAGTGMYATGVGESIKDAGETYRHVLKNNATFVMTDPRQNELCMHCNSLGICRETCSICTPITYNAKAIGIIGMVCFTQGERKRMLANLEVYKYFVEQMAHTLTMVVTEQQAGQQTQHILDMFLQITDNDHRGIVVLNTSGSITYINEMAKKTLEIDELVNLHDILVRKTGFNIYDMEEFEVAVGGRQITVVGRLANLSSDDPTFHQALVFDSLPNYTKMLSQINQASEATGLNAIVGTSKAILELKQKVLQIAKTSSTVLITGESGTGKEMFARAIHSASERKDKPFVPINCGAIPDALLESELFGYVSGAFTGASPSGHIGKFELAHQGVLFLDEIGSMPLYLQVKLLRVLQDRRIMRLGSNRVIEVDVRIIAASNESLPELIEQRMFRDDLYYRLNVIPLTIAPLRERTTDIPALASFFLDKYCKLFSKKLIRPTARLLSALADYSWPGNVREFENIMEYLVNIINEGGSATVGLLPAKIRAEASLKQNASLSAQVPVQLVTELHSSSQAPASPRDIIPLAELEKQAIIAALELYGSNAKSKEKIAEALGIGIATLYRKIKEMGLGA